MARPFAALPVLLSLASPAAAITVDIDFTSARSGYASSYSFAASGATLTVAAGRAEGDGVAVTDALVTRSRSGLGVSSAWYDRAEVDGLIHRDALVFSMDRAFRVEAIRFAGVDRDDDARLYGFPAASAPVTRDIDLPRSGLLASVFGGEWLDGMFGVGARDWTDDFRIAGIRVSFEDAVSATPAPGPLALLLGGFGVLGASLWRRGRGGSA